MYKDGIIRSKQTVDERIKHFCIVFSMLHRAGVTLKQKEGMFFTVKIYYLGHLIPPIRLQLDSAIKDTIRD